MSILSSIKLRVGFGVAAAALGGVGFALPATLASSGTASAGTATYRYCGSYGRAYDIQTIDTFCTTADPPAANFSCPSFFNSGTATETIGGGVDIAHVTCRNGGAEITYSWS